MPLLNQQKNSSISEQNTHDFFQNSIEINYSTGLYGDKDKQISNYIIKEIQDNKLLFTVRNKRARSVENSHKQTGAKNQFILSRP